MPGYKAPGKPQIMRTCHFNKPPRPKKKKLFTDEQRKTLLAAGTKILAFIEGQDCELAALMRMSVRSPQVAPS